MKTVQSMTEKQVEKVAHLLYDLDCLRGVRSQRWSVGAEKKSELYRAKARARLSERPFSRVLSELTLKRRRVCSEDV